MHPFYPKRPSQTLQCLFFLFGLFMIYIRVALEKRGLAQIAAPFSLEGLRYGWHIDPELAYDGQPVIEQPVLDPCARCVSSGGKQKLWESISHLSHGVRGELKIHEGKWMTRMAGSIFNLSSWKALDWAATMSEQHANCQVLKRGTKEGRTSSMRHCPLCPTFAHWNASTGKAQCMSAKASPRFVTWKSLAGVASPGHALQDLVIYEVPRYLNFG